MPYLTTKQMDERIGRMAGRFQTINASVQEIAESIVNHANETGDCDRAKRLTRSLPPANRRLLVTWFKNVSPIRVTMGKTTVEDKCSLRKPEQNGYNKFDLAKAKANIWSNNPFNDADAVPELETFDTYKASFERLFERMVKRTAEDAGKIAPEHIANVQALRAHMRDQFNTFVEGLTVPDTADNDGEEGEENAAETMAAANAA